MRKVLLVVLLLTIYCFSFSQTPNLGGTYADSGFLFNPSYSHQLNNNQNTANPYTKTLTEVSPNVYELVLADFGDGDGFTFQFEVDANDNLVNFVLSGTAPNTYQQGDFMTSDNPVSITYYPDTTHGYVHSSYPNKYDPVTNTFYLHYGYSLNAAMPFTRQVYEKIGTGPRLFPLKLLSFIAIKQDNNALLKWETANEFNTAYTNVQRSLNGTEFSTIGNVKAASSINASYKYNDDISRLKASTIYYRLQNVDRDGKYTYSDIRSVRLQGTSICSISPNPAKGYIIISGDNVKVTTISDQAGKKMLSAAGSRINISSLAKGLYFVSITGADGAVHVEKLLVE